MTRRKKPGALFMSYDQAKSVLVKLERALEETENVIAGFPRDRNGIIPDIVQFSHEFRFRKRELGHRRQALETFLKRFQKEFREQIIKEK